MFGAGIQMDAFEAAFRLPNILRRLFAEGAFSQAVLFRGVDLAIVWPLLAAIGTVYFAFALGRFRRVIFGT